MNIFLIGYRCTGKTFVGRSLAKSLGRPFLDADSELVKEQDLNISEIVRKQGWNAFRETLLNRNPLYEKAMDFDVDTDDIGIDEVCHTIIKKLNDKGYKYRAL